MTDYRDLHVSEVLAKAKGGDADAIQELIARQQAGEALRLYPYGRAGPDDEGMCPIMLHVEDLRLVMRSGRPSQSLVFDCERAQQWIFGVAECMTYIIGSYASQGLSHPAIEIAIESGATEDFDCTIEKAPDGDGIVIQFLPEGESSWTLSLEQASMFINKMMLAAQSMGWKMEATDQQLAVLKPYLTYSLGETNNDQQT